jgi:hypothetical protein
MRQLQQARSEGDMLAQQAGFGHKLSWSNSPFFEALHPAVRGTGT